MSFGWMILATMIFLISLSKIVFMQKLSAGSVLSSGVAVTYVCYYSGMIEDPLYLQVACLLWVCGLVLFAIFGSYKEDDGH